MNKEIKLEEQEYNLLMATLSVVLAILFGGGDIKILQSEREKIEELVKKIQSK